ncbi:hypothetical protein HAV_00075 [Candidatus Hepatincola sp. Av]
MKHTKFSQNTNTSFINQVTSAPEQSPIIVPANVETPVILRGPVEATSGSVIFFEYTNIEAGEFRIAPLITALGSINYVLAPESAEGFITLLIYLNGELSQSYIHQIKHADASPDVGTIDFYLHTHDSDTLKIVVSTTTENIVFADVVDVNRTVKIPALTMVLEVAS